MDERTHGHHQSERSDRDDRLNWVSTQGAQHAAGLMPSHAPCFGKTIAIENGIVRLSCDDPNGTTEHVMTLGPKGKMTHSELVDDQECIRMATFLWELRSRTLFVFEAASHGSVI